MRHAGIALGLAVIPVMFTIMKTRLPPCRANNVTPREPSRHALANRLASRSAFRSPGVLGFHSRIRPRHGRNMIVLMASGNAAIPPGALRNPSAPFLQRSLPNG